MSIKNHKIKIKLKYDEEDKFPNEILNLDAYRYAFLSRVFTLRVNNRVLLKPNF